ncbi:MAG: hypothetical protein A2268_10570 [Candidatus Raymondbacteria bacterium RifOxyA12_full_50_37]|uniref:Lipocalin/cytosolic fatty-acid binding domain-containing protein n=1 Tax=Candidatus Raymondbacteria bacterium RIFOXYD12_FULL_49_13 TaxID=1817890 RepID=A0A1F7F8T3_UNCRA|nr:MAG: hypothetical protein A2268_10570 [Candidatus Raymondbacteria bacterium RifOxyA12_full_50_37]OGJ85408.1 MAG: hypothetical protein A2248_12355 [Candidatus Raymondbacteria bacterium RIFOXYA2_FULL_49_16]OGJ86132.1 MAG: hypothetical protein A2350_18815 [Candidatus Raymondbacteria bacterium RifOxyB12_full_50_8]OGJ94916.1 MAG: hypothetical protein A2453_07825 [Candidatus Raymondbacteria bacterium RIFOXYC2_FULL_50_21]OGJ98674.1 MAG: hypothetical protein A2487_05675 [Candidatus Raymondbacteria b
MCRLLCLVFLPFICMSCRQKTPEFQPITSFDLNRYLGTWYEIARLPASFENGLVSVTAYYSLMENGLVKVVNKGIKDGKIKTAVGKAVVAGAAGEGYFRVSFFGPFYGDYVIVELDERYTYAMVASSKNYLWILSRTPVLEESIRTALIEKAKNLGFATENLYFTPQNSSGE